MYQSKVMSASTVESSIEEGYVRDCIADMNNIAMIAQGLVSILMSEALTDEQKKERRLLCLMMNGGDILARLSVFRAELGLLTIKDPAVRNEKILKSLSVVKRFKSGHYR